MTTLLPFASDYMEGTYPAILEKLTAMNLQPKAGTALIKSVPAPRTKYDKPATATTEKSIFSTVVPNQCHRHRCLLHRYEGVLAATTGHVSIHEAGAIEYTGHKVIQLPQTQGKLLASTVRQFMETFRADANNEHMVQPGMVYISHPTEYGTLYTKQELLL